MLRYLSSSFTASWEKPWTLKFFSSTILTQSVGGNLEMKLNINQTYVSKVAALYDFAATLQWISSYPETIELH